MDNALQLLIAVGIIINMIPSYPAVTICVNNGSTSSDDYNITKACDNTLTTLLDALELSHTLQNLSFGEPITLFLAEGRYSLPATPHAYFENVSEFLIVGLSDAMTIISCSPAGINGLSFVKSRRISLQKVTLTGCGQKHSTSGNLHHWSLSLVQFQASLYFEQCTDIVLNGITVTNSIGIATYFYATTGVNLIYDSTFSSSNKSIGIEGHGLVIEFPYCLPEDTSCNDLNSSLSRDAVSNAVFNISGCTFEENDATSYRPDTFSPIFSYFNQTNHESIEKGGGLSVLFEGHALNNSIIVSKSYFLDNFALFGGGLFIQIGDAASDNHVSIEECVFANNSALKKGGGSVINFFQNGIQSVQNNVVQFHKCAFTGNNASHGGGLSFYMIQEANHIHPLNALLLTETNFTKNKAHFGSAVDLSFHPSFHSGARIEPVFDDCSFTNNRIDYKQDGIIGSGTVYLDTIPVTLKNHVTFESNFGTPIVSLSSEITFSNNSKALFRNNTGGYGGAISLLDQATMIVGIKTSFDFANNVARQKGGALYASFDSEYDSMDSHKCFLQYIEPTHHPDVWETNFTFDSNRQLVDAKTNAIYATSILGCLWGAKNTVMDDSQLKKVLFCWGSASNTWMYKPNPVCRDNIITEPANLGIGERILNISLIPGQLTLLQLNASDDLGNNVTDDLVFSLISHAVGVDDSHRIVSNNKILLCQQNRTAGFVLLETEGSRSVGALINVSFQSCPLGFTLTNGSCDNCVGDIEGYVKCSSDFHLNVRQGFWIGPSPKDNTTLVTGLCKYCNTTAKEGKSFVLIPAFSSSQDETINDQCQKGRTGTLCSQCIGNYSPAVNTKTFECVECPGIDGVGFFYLILDFMFTTILYLVLLFTNFKLTSGPFSAVVLFAQLLTTALGDLNTFTANILHSKTWAKILTLIYEVPYGIWNLQFQISELAPHCIAPGMSNADVLALGYITALFPFILVLFSATVVKVDEKCFVWYRLKKRLRYIRPLYEHLEKYQLKAEVKLAEQNITWNQEARKRIRNTFASAVLLTYTKIALVTCYLLAPTPLLDASSNYAPHMLVLYIDGQFTPYEYQYIIPGLLFGVVIVFFPLFLMLFIHVNDLEEGQKPQPRYINHLLCAFQEDLKHSAVKAGNHCCQKFWNIKLRKIKLRDCETLCSDLSWMAGVYFYFRLAMLLVFTLSPNFAIQSTIQTIFCVVMAVIVTLVQPHREGWINKLDTCIFLLMATITSLNIYQYYNIISDTGYSVWAFSLQYFLILLPLMYMVRKPLFLVCQYMMGKLFTMKSCKRKFQKYNENENECQSNKLDCSITNKNSSELENLLINDSEDIQSETNEL